MHKLFFIFVLTIGLLSGHLYSEDLFIQKATNLRLWEDPEWLALLHMRRSIIGKMKSDVDDPDFFISDHGAKRPDLELVATLNAFFSNAVFDEEPAVCRFPARYRWLDQKLNLSASVPPQACDRKEAWLEKLKPTKVSLVFSSYYLNNPASMYGHTFLKLSREGYEPTRGLLDYTV